MSNSYHITLKKQLPEMFYKKKLFSKILQYSQENTRVGASFTKSCRPSGYFIKKRFQHKCFTVAKFLRNSFLKEHLRTAASELTFRSDCLELCFWAAAFKTILT